MRTKTKPASKVDKKKPANFKMKSRILLRISLTSSHRIWEKNKASPLPFYHPVVDDLHHHYFPDRDCLPKLEMCDYAKVSKPNIWTLQHAEYINTIVLPFTRTIQVDITEALSTRLILRHRFRKPPFSPVHT
jgi:hypothetical protein